MCLCVCLCVRARVRERVCVSALGLRRKLWKIGQGGPSLPSPRESDQVVSTHARGPGERCPGIWSLGSPVHTDTTCAYAQRTSRLHRAGLPLLGALCAAHGFQGEADLGCGGPCPSPRSAGSLTLSLRIGQISRACIFSSKRCRPESPGVEGRGGSTPAPTAPPPALWPDPHPAFRFPCSAPCLPPRFCLLPPLPITLDRWARYPLFSIFLFLGLRAQGRILTAQPGFRTKKGRPPPNTCSILPPRPLPNLAH